MSKKRIVIFFIIYFLFAISVNLVHPITVKYVNSLNLPDAYFGFLFSLMSLGQVVGAMFFGFLSDKIGRKWLIVIGLIGYCLSQLGFGFLNENSFIILIFRFLAGVSIAAPTTLFVSMCLDFSDKEQKVKLLTILSSCYILGTSFGYEIGGFLYDYLNFKIPSIFIFQIIFTFITALLFAIFIKDIKKNQEAVLKINNKENSIKNIKPIVYFLLFNLMVLTISQILINKYLDTYIIHIGYNPSTLGHYVFISGIVSAISNILLIPFIKKIKNKMLSICLLSFILLSSILTILTFTSKQENILYFLFSTHIIYIVLKGLITPLEQNELSLYSNQSNNGKVTGIRQTILSIGNVLGPLIGSACYTKGSPIIFFIAASINLLSFLLYIIYFILKRNHQA